MARIWTNYNRCVYVPEYVHIDVTFRTPILETAIDAIVERLLDIVKSYSIEKRFRVDADDLNYDEDSPEEVDGVFVLPCSGTVHLMAYCDHGVHESLEYEIGCFVAEYGGYISSVDLEADSSLF